MLKRKMSKREKFLIILLSAAALAYLYLNFSLFPNLSRISKLESELTSRKLAANNKAEAYEKLEDIDKQIEKSREKLKEIENKVPASIRIPELIYDFDSEIRRQGMNFKSISVGEADYANGGYGIVPVNVSLEGKYDDIIEFIKYIENSERLFIIDSFKIDPENRRTPFQTDIGLRTFVLKEDGSGVSAEPPDYEFFRHDSGKEYPFYENRNTSREGN